MTSSIEAGGLWKNVRRGQNLGDELVASKSHRRRHTQPPATGLDPKEQGSLPLPILTNFSRWLHQCWLEITEIRAVFGQFLIDFLEARLGVSDGQILRSRYVFSTSQGVLPVGGGS
ncbi:unnamed protein product [Prunus armeniaca]